MTLCEHGKGGSREFPDDSPAHESDGQIVYSDGSYHYCCSRHAKELRGLAHGPGRFVPIDRTVSAQKSIETWEIP